MTSIAVQPVNVSQTIRESTPSQTDRKSQQFIELHLPASKYQHWTVKLCDRTLAFCAKIDRCGLNNQAS